MDVHDINRTSAAVVEQFNKSVYAVQGGAKFLAFISATTDFGKNLFLCHQVTVTNHSNVILTLCPTS